MAFPAEPADRADQIFRTGPEDLVGRSTAIVAGPVTGHTREAVRTLAQGPGGLPAEWIVHAQIDQPTTLKGTPPPAPIRFSRRERSFLHPGGSIIPIWEMNFGELKPDGEAVLFFGEGPEPEAVPSGAGPADLVTLLRHIVRVQSLPDAVAERRIWLTYPTIAARTSSAEGSKVALRSLVHNGAEWSEIEMAILSLPADPDLRVFAFAFVAFNITGETWGKDSAQAVDFLCRTFSGERDVEQQLRQLQSFKLLVRYTAEEPRQASRQPYRECIAKCLEDWASHGPSDPQLTQEYERIRSQYRPREYRSTIHNAPPKSTMCAVISSVPMQWGYVAYPVANFAEDPPAARNLIAGCSW